MIKALIFDFMGVLLVQEDFELNSELLNYLENFKEKYPLYIFTTSSFANEPKIKVELDKIFKDIFTVDQFGSKKEPESFTSLLNHLKLQPEEVIFTDDTPPNVEAAKRAGIRSIYFESNEELLEELKQLT